MIRLEDTPVGSRTSLLEMPCSPTRQRSPSPRPTAQLASCSLSSLHNEETANFLCSEGTPMSPRSSPSTTVPSTENHQKAACSSTSILLLTSHPSDSFLSSYWSASCHSSSSSESYHTSSSSESNHTSSSSSYSWFWFGRVCAAKGISRESRSPEPWICSGPTEVSPLPPAIPCVQLHTALTDSCRPSFQEV